MLKVCVYVCHRVEAAVGAAHPSCPLPLKGCIKDGGRGTFVTLLSVTETITLSLDTQTLWTHTFSRDILIILRKEAPLCTGFFPWRSLWTERDKEKEN